MNNKKAIYTKNAPDAIGPYSQGVAIGDLLFVSGQTPIIPVTGNIPNSIEDQARQTLENVSAVLLAGGSSMSSAVN